MFLLIGDHAGNLVPETLRGFGLAKSELQRHIALDLGIARLGGMLSQALDAPFIEQRYSRLVIDCNRAPGTPGSILAESDGTPIPANRDITAAGRAARETAIFAPYHDAIAGILAERDEAGKATIVVALHSFTPQLNGISRPWEIGVLHDRGAPGFALAVLGALESAGLAAIGDNQPYRMDETDYTVPRHAYGKLRPYVELEIRQDRLADRADQARIAAMLRAALEAARDVQRLA